MEAGGTPPLRAALLIDSQVLTVKDTFEVKSLELYAHDPSGTLSTPALSGFPTAAIASA